MMRSQSSKKEKRRSLKFKIVLLSITLVSIISISLNFSIYFQYGRNYQVFLGPNEYHKALLEKIDILFSQLKYAEAMIKQLQQNITNKDAEISKLTDELYLKDKEIERLRLYELRFVKVTGSVNSPGTPLEIIFKEAFCEYRYKISPVDGKYMFEATLENNKEYTVIIIYENKWWIIPLGARPSEPITFLLNSDNPTLIKDFSV